MTKHVIHIGDGKHIEVTEGALRLPLPPPVVIKPLKGKAFKKAKADSVPGWLEWYYKRHKQTKAISPHAGRLLCQKFGQTRDKTNEGWYYARIQAKEDMTNIKKAGIDLDTAGEEALLTTLELMRSPADAKFKLQAARQVLEWTKAKPVSKSEVTLNSAEAWLASLAKDHNDESNTDSD